MIYREKIQMELIKLKGGERLLLLSSHNLDYLWREN